MKLKYFCLPFVLLSSLAMAQEPPSPPPLGDTQGFVSAVRIENNSGGRGNTFRVYFSYVVNDRFNCIANNGYVTIREDNLYVTPESYKAMYEMALDAIHPYKMLALDSSNPDPCNNVTVSTILVH